MDRNMKNIILAGWLVHVCCNNSLVMAPWCRNNRELK